MVAIRRGSLRDRLLSRTRIEPNGCVIFTGYLNPAGYGQIGREGGRGAGTILAHHAAYELFIGPIPEGLELDHLCERPACIAPAHLEAVTHGENLARRYSRSGKCSEGHALTPSTRGRGRECVPCRVDYNRRHRAARKALTW